MAKRAKRAERKAVRKGVKRRRRRSAGQAAARIGRLPIAELEKALAAQQRRLKELRGLRGKLVSQLEAVDHLIARLSGSSGNGRRRRSPAARAAAKPVGRPPKAKAKGKGKGLVRQPRSGATLGNKLVEILTKAPGPMKMNNIIEAVRKSNYPSKSAHLRSMVSQTLKRDPRFRNVRRGIYKLV